MERIIENKRIYWFFSGGPLMARMNDDRWEIVGITSYGKGCGRLNELGIYTRVSMYINWIEKTIETLEGYSSRSFDKLDHVFFNSASNSRTNFFLIVYVIFIRINQCDFYL